jgi:hypothetical protein
VLVDPLTAIVNGVGIVKAVPTFGISKDGLLKVSVTVGAAKLIFPLRVPFIETEIGEELPTAKGAVSVSVRVKVEPAGILMSVLALTFEKVKVPKAGLPVVVMSVNGCGVYVSDTLGLKVTDVDVVPPTVNDPEVE